MKLATTINYSGDLLAGARRVVELERAGVDLVWIPEAYGFDAVSYAGFIAAMTSTIHIGTGVLNVFSRTASCIAQTATGLDMVSDGRFVLGLGASGPQVIEGFHGVPFERPLRRIDEYIEHCRSHWAGESPARRRIPIHWGSLMGNAVAHTARSADGWLPVFFDPAKFRSVWGADLERGRAGRDPALGPLQITAGGLVAIDERLVGDLRSRVLDTLRPYAALSVGGMGTRDVNFSNRILCLYGFEAEASAVQDRYLAGRKNEAAAAIPEEFLAGTNLVGPPGLVRERLAAYREAGVTHLSVDPVGADPILVIDRLRSLIG